MVTLWLIRSMVLELASSIIYSYIAQAIWMDLEECFSQPNSTKIYDVKKVISNCKQRNLSITTYYTHLKILWDELASYIAIPSCSCGAAKTVTHLLQQDPRMQFLQGLNDSYLAIRSQILLNEPLPKVNKIYSLLLQEERQRLISVSTSTSNKGYALVVSQGNNRQNFKLHHSFPTPGKPGNW